MNLTCDALGSPEPRIMWKREDNQMIKYDAGEGTKIVKLKNIFMVISKKGVFISRNRFVMV